MDDTMLNQNKTY